LGYSDHIDLPQLIGRLHQGGKKRQRHFPTARMRKRRRKVGAVGTRPARYSGAASLTLLAARLFMVPPYRAV